MVAGPFDLFLACFLPMDAKHMHSQPYSRLGIDELRKT